MATVYGVAKNQAQLSYQTTTTYPFGLMVSKCQAACMLSRFSVVQVIFPTQGANPRLVLPALQKGSSPLAPPGKPRVIAVSKYFLEFFQKKYHRGVR